MTREKNDNSHPTVAEAVETLSSIAEMDFDREIALATNDIEEIIPSLDKTSEFPPPEIPLRPVEWLYDQTPEDRVEIIKGLFKVILNYLKNFYKKQYRYLPNRKDTEGVKAIMVLVGEAAKKIDKHKEFFENCKLKTITELPEYRRLQEFYISRIARKIDESTLSKWIMGLSQRLIKTQDQFPVLSTAKHIFVDLDSVKKDSEYELFFIRKEDGSRFFSPQLIRNMKLVCDFGDRLSEVSKIDPLEDIRIWKNQICIECAKDILEASHPFMNQYYREVTNLEEKELCGCLGKALMALMLCNNPHNKGRDPSLKNNADYFIDFQSFLRKALNTRDYQKVIAYPEKATKGGKSLADLAHSLCQAYFTCLRGYKTMMPQLMKTLQEARERAKSDSKGESILNEWLEQSYLSLSKHLKCHASGPLIKVLDILEEGNFHAFDPISQDNIPCVFFSLDVAGKSMDDVRIPSPIYQEFIHKAAVCEEFKGFLRSLTNSKESERFLYINLQDRTSWREHSRCTAIEDLQKHPDFSKELIVVTLTKDTEFYYQEAPYNKDNQASSFIKTFRRQLEDEGSGYYFPESIKKALFPHFIDGILNQIHKVFFKGRNVLPIERRLDFIEIAYLFIELKILELVKPSAFSLACKDGVDKTPTANALLYTFLRWMQNKWDKNDQEMLAFILFAPAMIVRERLVQSDPFYRFLNVLKEMELVRNEQGQEQFPQLIVDAFGPYFDTDIPNVIQKLRFLA